MSASAGSCTDQQFTQLVKLLNAKIISLKRISDAVDAWIVEFRGSGSTLSQKLEAVRVSLLRDDLCVQCQSDGRFYFH